LGNCFFNSIRARSWAATAQNSWLGLPVTDELLGAQENFTYVVFERGYIEQSADGSDPVEHPHDYLQHLQQQIAAQRTATAESLCSRWNTSRDRGRAGISTARQRLSQERLPRWHL